MKPTNYSRFSFVLLCCISALVCSERSDALDIPKFPLYILPPQSGVGVGSQLQLRLYTAIGSGTGRMLSATKPNSWSSSDSSIAKIDKFGRVKGLRRGIVTITAVTDGYQVTTKVKVGKPVAKIIAADSVQVLQYCSSRLTTEVNDEAGKLLVDRPVLWKNSSQEIAATEENIQTPFVLPMPSGDPLVWSKNTFYRQSTLIHGKTPGQTSIIVTSEGKSANTLVTVTAAPANRVDVSPSTIVLDIGSAHSVQLSAVAKNEGDCVVPRVPLTWTISDPNVASLNPVTHKLTGLKAGHADITVTALGGLVGHASVTVPAVATIELTSASVTLSMGESKEIRAKLFSDTGQALDAAEREITWSKIGDSIYITPTTGDRTEAFAQSLGNATVTATSEQATATATITVESKPTCSGAPSNSNATEYTVLMMSFYGCGGKYTAFANDLAEAQACARAAGWIPVSELCEYDILAEPGHISYVVAPSAADAINCTYATYCGSSCSPSWLGTVGYCVRQ